MRLPRLMSTRGSEEANARPVITPAAPQGGWLQRLGPYLRAHRWRIAIAVAASVVGQVVVALTPVIVKTIVDDTLVEPNRAIEPLLALLVGAAVVAFVLAVTRRALGGRVAIDVSYDLRTAVYDRLQRLDFATHDRMDTGQVVSRASSDVGMMLAILSIVPILLGNVVLLVVSLIVMAVLSPPLTLIALLMVPLLLVTGLKMRNAVFPATWDAQQRAGEVAGVVDEAVTGVRVVKGFGQEERELRHLAGTAEGPLQVAHPAGADPGAVHADAVVDPGPRPGRRARLRRLAGDRRAHLARHVPRLLVVPGPDGRRRCGCWPRRWRSPSRRGPAAERLLDILDTPSNIVDAPDAVTLGPVRSEIRFDGRPLPPRRGRPRRARRLRPARARRRDGGARGRERLGQVDRGAAPATLLRRVVGGDHHRRRRRPRRRRCTRCAARSPSRSRRCSSSPTSVRANIAYGRPDATDDEVVAAARLAQADGFIRRLPDGYDTVVGERGLTLSGGQRQRIALARALLTDPSVLVLDDATSSIDAETEEPIHGALRSITSDDRVHGRTTILIAHRQSTLRLADRIVVLDHGRVVDDGTYEELVANSATFRDLFLGPSTVEVARAGGDGRRPRWKPPRTTPTRWRSTRRPGRTSGSASAAWWRRRASPRTAGANPGRGGGGGGGGGQHGQRAVRRRRSCSPSWPSCPPADDDPELDVEAEMRRPTEPFHAAQRSARRSAAASRSGSSLVVIDTGLTLLGPFFVKRGIDRGVDGRATSRRCWLASLGSSSPRRSATGSPPAATRGSPGAPPSGCCYALRIRIFAHLQRLSLDYYDRELGGRVMTRMTTDVEALVAARADRADQRVRQRAHLRRRVRVPRHPVAAAGAGRRRRCSRRWSWRRRGTAGAPSVTYERARDRIAERQRQLPGEPLGRARRRRPTSARSATSAGFRAVNGATSTPGSARRG